MISVGGEAPYVLPPVSIIQDVRDDFYIHGKREKRS